MNWKVNVSRLLTTKTLGERTMYGLIGKLIAQPGQREALSGILLNGVVSMPACLN